MISKVTRFASLFIIISASAHATPTQLEGIVTKVSDGGTIEVGPIPIRLNGVSAPKLNERLGPKSKVFMTDLVMGKQVGCELNGEKTDGIDAGFVQHLPQPIQGDPFKVLDLLTQLPVQGRLVGQLLQRINVGKVDHETP